MGLVASPCIERDTRTASILVQTNLKYSYRGFSVNFVSWYMDGRLLLKAPDVHYS